MARRRDSGQVGVETAIIMPMTVFMILGILQLSMMQQARILTEYAAFRAVRAGSLDFSNTSPCKKMLQAAVQGVLPSMGRTDTTEDLLLLWTVGNIHTHLMPKLNQTGFPLLDVVDIDYMVKQSSGTQQTPYTAQDFDDPDHSLYLVAQVSYQYELRIPFADFMIHEMWTGGNYLGGHVDQLVPAQKTNKNLTDIQVELERVNDFANDPVNTGNKAKILAAASTSHRYFVPIVASYSMRMMSNLPTSVSVNTKQTCTGIP